MVYDVWMNLLQKKLDGWYNTYAKSENRIQVFQKYGVAPSFFEKLGDVNPLKETPFHELSLMKKSCILKALCSHMFHSNKKIEEYFNVVEERSLRAQMLTSDSKYNYFCLFSPEIRVYRASNICLDVDQTFKAVHPNYSKNQDRDENPSAQQLYGEKIYFSRKQKFCLIAHDTESLKHLAKTFVKKKLGKASIHKLLTEEKNSELSLIGLRALHSQWKKPLYKQAAALEISKTYWIDKDTNNPSASNNKQSYDSATPRIALNKYALPVECVSGKRTLKRKYPVADHDDSYSSSEEKPNDKDDVDWADSHRRQNQRIKKGGVLPRFFDVKYMTFSRANYKSRLDGTQNPDLKPKRRGRRRSTFSTNENCNHSKFESFIAPNSSMGNLAQSELHNVPYLLPTISNMETHDKGHSINVDQHFETTATSSNLFDLTSWDSELETQTGTPLKLVENVKLPDEGDNKLLELGVYKCNEEESKKREMNLKTNISRTPKKVQSKPTLHQSLPSQKYTVPPPICQPELVNMPHRRKHIPSNHSERFSFLQTNEGFPLNQFDIIDISHNAQNRITPQRENSHVSKRVYMHRPLNDIMRKDALNIVSNGVHDVFMLKTGMQVFNLPITPAPQSVIVQNCSSSKRKVNIPAQPLKFSIYKNENPPIFERQEWAKQNPAKPTVLYVPSGTPTVSVPSIPFPKEEGTLTVL